MTEPKKNKIPLISAERLNSEPLNNTIGNTKEEKLVYAFLKGKEPTQPFTIRIPNEIYQDLRKIAFLKNKKINQIVVGLIKDYNKKNNDNVE